MIPANELRIGNYYNHYGEYKKVTPNTIFEVWEADRLWCMPIPLTPEILEKCGFIYSGQFNNYTIEYYLRDGVTVQFSNIGTDHTVCIELKGLTDVKKWVVVNYLHQLQNLIHALTGEELRVNL